jgi:hypothetical protein
MAATQVQKATNTSAGAATLSVGSAQGWAAPTAGNVLVAWANANITMTLSGWTAGPSVVDGNGAYMWYKSAAGTETTITFSAGSSVTGWYVRLRRLLSDLCRRIPEYICCNCFHGSFLVNRVTSRSPGFAHGIPYRGGGTYSWNSCYLPSRLCWR